MGTQAQMTHRNTLTFAETIENLVDEHFASLGIVRHGICVEKTNDSAVTLVRSALTSDGHKNITLSMTTPECMPLEATVRLRRKLREHAKAGKNEHAEPTNEKQLERDLANYLARATRAHLRTKAINSHQGTTERSAYANTVHTLVKAWLEHEGRDLEQECAQAYLNAFQSKGSQNTIDVGKWYFVDGYAVCEGIQSKDRSIKLFGMQGTRCVVLELNRVLPETVVHSLPGKTLSNLVADGFLGEHGDLKIVRAHSSLNPNGENVLIIHVEPAEVPMGDVPEGFDMKWSSVNPEEKV